MNDVEQLKAQVVSLQTRVAYQDGVIEDLNKSVTGQWRQLDALTKQVERMAARLQHVEDNAPRGEAEPPPPHY